MLRLTATAALAGALALTGAPASAQSSVTIAGTMDVGIRQVKNGRLGHITSEVSGSNSTSKLILRGTEEMGGGLYAGFFLDATVLGDTGGTNTTFWDRRSTVSVGHVRHGELRLGRDWVPTHLLWTGFDPFTTLGIASANAFRSVFASRALGQAFGATADAAAQNPTLRVNNAVEYFLPGNLGGVYGAVMASAGENGSAGAGATKGEGGRLGFANKTLNVAVAQYKARNANGNQTFTDQAWGASYDFGAVRASLAQRRWRFGNDRTTSTLLGATLPFGQHLVKLSVVRADQSGATAAQSANDATLLGAGYLYLLSKRSALYAHVARVSNKAGAAFAIPGGPPTSGVSTATNYFGGQSSKAWEFGIRHDF